jgi:CRISPR/Cas system-associated exonuclease Cas4 (RecB family)
VTKNLLKQIMLKPAEKKSFINTQDIIEKLKSGYVAGLVPKHTQKKTFAPSTIAYGHGECPRYWYLAFEGNIFESSSTPFDVANMNSGSMSHDRIQGAMMASGLAKVFKDDNDNDTTEFKITHSDPPIFGYGDAIIDWEGEEIVAEIKTTNNEAFEYYKNNSRPKKSHVIQLLIYMKILQKAKGVLIYENKNNHDLLVFPIEVNDVYKQWVDYAFSWMQEVRKAWKEKTMPTKNYRSNAKVCKTCPVKAACDVAGVGSIKIESLEELSEIV